MSEALHSKIADALARLATLARSSEQGGADAEAVSPLQARVLNTLARRGALRVGDIAQELLVTHGTASLAISALAEKELIAKTPDPSEHRAVLVELTRRGKAVARKAGSWVALALEPAVQRLPAARAGELLATLLDLILELEDSGAIARSRMCLTCRHFRRSGGSGERPHFCALLESPIRGPDLRVECADHEWAVPPMEAR
ncbi:MAG: MarR family winged helix-turn-helix transcriptional regulator [Planctomycetota bacterium]